MKILKENIIKSVKGFEVLDSRGNPTLAAQVTLFDETKGFAVVPSGASTGQFEAYEKRDGEKRFGGKGVKNCVEIINEKISQPLAKLNTLEQEKIDDFLIKFDATENKSILGANTILAVSLATARAAAAYYRMPLYRYIGGINAAEMPKPMLNILNGGVHAANNIDIQEFMIIPKKAETFSEGLRQCTEIYHTLGNILKEKGKLCGVGDEGGFAPNLQNDEEAFEVIINAIEKSGYNTEEIKIAIDVASSEWYKNGEYVLPKRNKKMTGDELIEYYDSLTEKYPIFSIEDGLSENDWQGWRKMTKNLGSKIQLVGDDLFVTNESRLLKGIQEECANSVLIKPNQIGTLSETLKVMRTATQNGYNSIVSHRSGDSEDTFIADLSVAVNAGAIKTGAPCRSERTAKYNRLLIIEKELEK